MTRAPLAGAAGISLNGELVPNPGPRGAPGGGEASAEARVHTGGGKAVVLGYEDGVVYAGVRGEGGLDVRFRRSTREPPKHYRADWDGEILSLWVDSTFLWSIRPDWKKEGEELELAVARGRALFRQITVIALE